MPDPSQYDELRECLYPPNDARFEALEQRLSTRDREDFVLWMVVDGFFWFPRRLFGIEEHFYAFFDYPDLMHRMNADLAEHSIGLLRRVGEITAPDFVTFAEDMSYNHGPMLSEGMFEEFLEPYYRQVVPVIEEIGSTPICDSDGDVTEMIPWLERVGLQGVLPLERQAGVDGMALREAHPELILIGHYDKMVMNRGEDAIRGEFERLLPLMRSGRFVPSVDHQTPPGVSLEEYRVYLEAFREYAQLGA
jgi:uroporphyrinogen-III decarboxylase